MFPYPVFLYRPNLSRVVDLAKIRWSQTHTSQVFALLQVLKASIRFPFQFVCSLEVIEQPAQLCFNGRRRKIRQLNKNITCFVTFWTRRVPAVPIGYSPVCDFTVQELETDLRLRCVCAWYADQTVRVRTTTSSRRQQHGSPTATRYLIYSQAFLLPRAEVETYRTLLTKDCG